MTAGIVCEYNPFHNGHLYHINKIKEKGAGAVVCVMSGNFVQRGECACLDKWTRAEMAVRNGADVVIDLPTPWASAPAGTFARGSVGLLMDFGIDSLSFGSETDDKNLLLKCVAALKDEAVGELLRKNMSEGMTYPKALSGAVKDILGNETAECLFSPNSTLAIEYLKVLQTYDKKVDFLPVLRVGADHDSEKTASSFASASLLRSMNLGENIKDFVPESAYDLIRKQMKAGCAPCALAENERAVLSALREMKKEDYSLYVSDETGLADRIYDAVKTATSLTELYESVKVKNYTHSRIRREIMMLYLKCPKELCNATVPYMKILAVSEKGLTLLKEAKENSTVPIITRYSDTDTLDKRGKAVYEFECSATDKFALFSKKIRVCGLERTHSLNIIR